MIRQGDLLFVPVDEIPEFSKQKNERGIIREGEATGHHHRLELLDAGDVFRPLWGAAFVSIRDPFATIVHDEHGPVTLPKGNYRVHVAREFDYMSDFGARYVRD